MAGALPNFREMADRSSLEEEAPPSPLLEKLFTDAILSLTLMSKAKAIRLQPESSRQKPGATPPPPAHGPEEWLQREWDQCVNNRTRLLVVKKAQEEVNKMRFGGVKSERYAGTLDWKMAVAQDPRKSTVVAQIYGISASYVRTLRKRYGTSGSSGTP